MSRRFCPKCGKKITEGTFCNDCAPDTFTFKPPLIQISEYNRTFHNGIWHHFTDLDELIISRIRESLDDPKADIVLEPFEFTPRKKEKITVQGTAKTNDRTREVSAKLSYRQCDHGEKRSSSYFEGVLQLRNIKEIVLPFLQELLSLNERKGVFVTKTVDQKKGVDLYLTDKNAIQQIARQLQQRFGGELNIGAKLFTRNHQTSKDVYRLNVFLKFPDYTKGDVISYFKVKEPDKPRYMKVTGVGKTVFGKNLLSGKQENFQPQRVNTISICPLQKTTVSSTQPQLAVLDPEDYQEVIPANTSISTKEFKEGERIKVVKTLQGILLVP
ncbi:MAG: NMD3-related protein [Nanobdellota archaeon]